LVAAAASLLVLVVCDQLEVFLARTQAHQLANLLRPLILHRPRLSAGLRTGALQRPYAEEIFELHLFPDHLSHGALLLLMQALALNLKSRWAWLAKPVMELKNDHLAPCLALAHFFLLAVTAALHLLAPHFESDPRRRSVHGCGFGFVVFLERLRLLQQCPLRLAQLQ